jgi:hypothetical protein
LGFENLTLVDGDTHGVDVREVISFKFGGYHFQFSVENMYG